MATRNVGASQSLNRTSTAPGGGNVLKSRQLVGIPLTLTPFSFFPNFPFSSPPRSSSSSPPQIIFTRGLTRDWGSLSLLRGPGAEGTQAQLHSQLAQLSANLSDTENLLRMTSVQAEAMRGLGSWHGGL